MGIWLDLILIAVLLISIVIGAKKGLFSVVKRFRLILSVFLAWQLKLTPFVRGLVGRFCKIDKEYLYNKIDEEFGQRLAHNINNSAIADADKFDATFGKFGGILSGARDFFMSKIAEGTENAVAEITKYVADAVYELIFAVIGFAVLTVFFFILFTVVYHIVNKILNVGILGMLNHFLGGVFGAVTGFIWIWLLAILFVKVGPIVFSTDPETIAGGFGLVRWLIGSFFLSGIFGVTL